MVGQKWVGLAGLALILAAASPARSEETLYQGKTPAQLYAIQCGECRRNPRALGNPAGSLAGFLREHYTTGSGQAAAIAAYVQSIGGGVMGRRSGAASRASRMDPDAQPPSSPAERVRGRKPDGEEQAVRRRVPRVPTADAGRVAEPGAPMARAGSARAGRVQPPKTETEPSNPASAPGTFGGTEQPGDSASPAATAEASPEVKIESQSSPTGALAPKGASPAAAPAPGRPDDIPD